MPAPDANRDPFDKSWERIATIWANLEALFQSDVRANESILKRTALALNTPRFHPSPGRFTTGAMSAPDPDDLADRTGSNLEKLVAEAAKRDLMNECEGAWFDQKRRDLARLLDKHYFIRQPISNKAKKRLDEARSLYLRTFQ